MECMPYLHTRINIISFLKKKVVEFGLKGKITCVVTDNGSNMVNAINQWDDVDHLPYAAHILQLLINHAFQKTNVYIKWIKRLVYFFISFLKQSECFNDAQKECQQYNNTTSQNISDSFTDDDTDDNDNSINEPSMLDSANSKEPILRNIADIKTQQNSKYYFWNHLLKLRKAIEWLDATLPLSDNSDDHADGRKLKKWLLLPYEQDLLKQIVDLLKLFDETTIYFSEIFYTTLSIIYPLIQVLKFKYAYESSKEDDDNLEIEQNKFIMLLLYYLNLYYLLIIIYFIAISNFQHEESDEENDSDNKDNLELDNPE